MKKQKIIEYSTVSKWLHWLSALIIIGLLGGGLTMVGLEDGDPQKLFIYRFHGIMGSLLVFFTLARIIIRWRSPQPLPEGLASWNKTLYLVIHWGIYLTLLMLGFSGMTTLLTNGVNALTVDPALLNRDIPTIQGHFLFTRLIILLVLLHIGGLFRHQFTKGNVLSRMGLNLKIGKA